MDLFCEQVLVLGLEVIGVGFFLLGELIEQQLQFGPLAHLAEGVVQHPGGAFLLDGVADGLGEGRQYEDELASFA